ncbi:MAG: DUF6973 domain-containing protein [Porticoccaceae bacterium]
MNTALLNLDTAEAEGNRIAAQMGFTDFRQIDAFRHTVWQAAMTQAYGEAWAQGAGDLNEILGALTKQSEPTDRNMDPWNNREGREIGQEAANQGLTDEQLYETIAEAVRNGRLVADHKNDLRVDPKYFWELSLIPTPIIAYERLKEIGNTINTLYLSARNFFWRDPLALDLDGDGIETVGASSTLLFDHDGDGTKSGTGWVRSDDGLLAWDRNGNGIIDTGAELFGVDYIKANGQKAVDGFDALDLHFNNVRVWRDASQDGVSAATELHSLNALGIAAINLDVTIEQVNLGNGNVQTGTATYLRADGTSESPRGSGWGRPRPTWNWPRTRSTAHLPIPFPSPSKHCRCRKCGAPARCAICGRPHK